MFSKRMLYIKTTRVLYSLKLKGDHHLKKIKSTLSKVFLYCRRCKAWQGRCGALSNQNDGGDFFTKPLRGSQFYRLRDKIMNIDPNDKHHSSHRSVLDFEHMSGEEMTDGNRKMTWALLRILIARQSDRYPINYIWKTI